MIDATLERRIKQIEDTVKHLLELHRMQFDASLPHSQKEHACFMALRSMVVDLASNAGVSTERVAQCFEARVRYYLAQSLQRADDIDQSLAARADDRTPDEVSTDETLPPLFDDPSSPES
jgi:hypothetical protein